MKRKFRRSFQCLGINSFSISYFKDYILDCLISNDDNNNIYVLTFKINNQDNIACTVILVQNLKGNNLNILEK
jgi:hypothetical protein